MGHQRRPVWPTAGVVACLVALAVGVLWSWRERSSETPLQVRYEPAAGQPQVTIRATARHVDRPADAATGPRPDICSPGQPEVPCAPRQHLRSAPAVADCVALVASLPRTARVPRLEPSHDAGAEAVRGEPAADGQPGVRGAAAIAAQRVVRSGPACGVSWPYPSQLMSLLVPLGDNPLVGRWADRVRASLRQLHATPSLGSPAAAASLARLQELAQEGQALASEQADFELRAAVMRVTHSLQRRLAIWQPIHRLAVPRVVTASLRDDGPADLTVKLSAMDARLGLLTRPEEWRQYLLMDRLILAASGAWQLSARERSELAREFLERLESSDATAEQKEFFQHIAFRAFADQLRTWVCEPVDYPALLEDIERIETSSSERVAGDLADYYQWLRWSADPQLVELADRINIYYRNANVRLAISAELLNRLLPHEQSIEEDVNDRLMGGRVFGRSRVTTRLQLVLLPDRERWHLGLEAHGNVDSRTHTKRGPARFHNAGRSHYLARKLLLIDRRGIHAADAEATARTNADLTGMETDLDGVPLVNLLVRAVARQMYDRQADEAQQEAQGLLASRVESRLNDEVDQKLEAATEKLRREVWNPLHDLGLRPEAVDMETTPQRLIARYRLAAPDQVAAFTPRPQAPASSWLSVQVHESMLNNVVSSLDLGGREMALSDMFLEVARKLNRHDFQVPADVPRDVTIELASTDPIRFECVDDRLHVILRIRKLTAGADARWEDFQVRALYLPHVEGMHVGLQRDGYVPLKGERRRLPMRDQIALRTIFTKVFASQPDLDLLANVLASDSRLHDLQVSQFVLHNGWVGIAVGPRGPAQAHLDDRAGEIFAR